MIVIDLIEISEDRSKFTYWYYIYDKMMVHTYSGSSGGFEKTFYKLQINLLAEMFSEFLKKEKSIYHSSKELFLYKESIEKIEKLIKYIFDNEHKYEAIKKLSAGKAMETLKYLYSLVPEDDQQKKYLLFILHCVTLNANHRIKVYEHE